MAWLNLKDASREALRLAENREGIVAEGRIQSSKGRPILSYRIACDSAWHVRTVLVRGPSASISLTSDGAGHWTDAAGGPLPSLSGCLDVDIQATPFTNTLPIRRLALKEGEARTLRVAYIAVPSLEVTAVTQTYTGL